MTGQLSESDEGRDGRFPTQAAGKTRLVDAAKTWLPVCGFAITLLLFYPGGMRDPDSVDQFQQSLAFHFNDWHPAIMALLWSGLNKIWTGPQLMLMLQLTLYWTSVAFVLNSVNKDLPRRHFC